LLVNLIILLHTSLQDNDGNTPLHYATLNGHTHIAKLLLDENADINTQDNDGNTPLHYAAQKGYSEIIKLLFQQNGIHKEIRNKDKKKPVDLAQGKEIKKLFK
jgi:ankyrin repeat protein